MKPRIILLALALFVFSAKLSSQEIPSFFDVEKIQDIQFTFKEDNWRYLLDSLRFNGDEMWIANVAINGEQLQDVGVRFIESRAFKPGVGKNGIYVQLDKVNKDQEYKGNKSLVLSNEFRDPSFLREVMALEVARNYMPAPMANFVKVKVNGAHFGLFVNKEPIESSFLKRNFDYTYGALFKASPKRGKASSECKPRIYSTLQQDKQSSCYIENFERISMGGSWDELIELTRVLEEQPEEIGKVLDVDKTLWFLAFNNLLGNLEGYLGQYSSNYYLYKGEDGRFIPVLGNTTLSFGSFKNTGKGSDLDLDDMTRLDPFLHADEKTKPLVRVLLANEKNRKVYLSHFREIMRSHFASGKFEERAKQLQQLIHKPYVGDPNKQYSYAQHVKSLYEMTGNRSLIPGIVNYMEKRMDFLKFHKELTVLPPKISEVKVAGREAYSSQKISDFKITAKVEKFANTVQLFYRFNPGDEFQVTEMLDDGENDEGNKNNDIYGITIKPVNGAQSIEYYIYAENVKMVSFSPKRYMYELHTTNLKELNK